MFWLLPGLGAQGIGPGNLAFLEHGSRSVSCVTGRLPFHTTMKNHKFQHFRRNKPRTPWLTISQSISRSISVSAAWLDSSQRLHDLSLHAQNIPFLSRLWFTRPHCKKLLSANNYNIITNYKFGKRKKWLDGISWNLHKKKKTHCKCLTSTQGGLERSHDTWFKHYWIKCPFVLTTYNLNSKKVRML